MFPSYKILFFLYAEISLFSYMVLERDPEAYQLRGFSDYVALEDEDEEDGDGGFVCNEKQLTTYLAKLQIINPESVVFLTTVQNIDYVCKTVDNSLAKIDMYFKTCQPAQQKELYKSLVKGVRNLHKKLCLDNNFKKEFEKHSTCYRQLHKEYQRCSGPADWSENPKPAFVCKVYQDITNCFYSTTSKLCDTESASKFKDLVVTIISSMLPVKCNISNNVSSTSVLESPIPREHNTMFYTILIPLIILVPIAILTCIYVLWRVLSKSRVIKENEVKLHGKK